MVVSYTEEVLEKAMIFAIEAHKGQKRKGDKRPYITHPMEVMALLWKYKKSENMYLLAVAAVLHDTVEDCEGVTIEIITEEFGLPAAALVQELSFDKSQYELLGKQEYQSQQINMMSSYAFYIKLVDIYVNICDMESLPEEKQMEMLKDKEYIIKNCKRRVTSSQQSIIRDINIEIGKVYQRLVPQS
jgi:(p)ppGpp synthase/HD superfamily hydrolase